MVRNSGYVVEWENSRGEKQKGYVLHTDQHPKFEKLRKVSIRLINEDTTFKKDDQEKDMKIVKSIDTLKVIGFVD